MKNVSVAPGAVDVTPTALPLFRDAPRWDYRLRTDFATVALARDRVDFVDETAQGDLDLRPRVVAPSADVGPNEFASAIGDELFGDNFEVADVPRFNEFLVSVFTNPRCQTCHTVAHFEDAVTNRFPHTGQDLATCAGGCHSGLGEQDLSNWHAPRDLRLGGLSTRQLCNLAKRDPHPGISGHEHLTQDPLILWAVSDGEVPGGGASGSLVQPATDLTTPQWIELIDEWFENRERTANNNRQRRSQRPGAPVSD